MKKSKTNLKTLDKFFTAIILLFLSSFLLTLFICYEFVKGYGFKFDENWKIVLALLFSIFVSISCTIWFLSYIKQEILKSMSIIPEYIPTNLSQFPRLNLINLEKYTQTLEALGFTRLEDLTLEGENGKKNPSMARIFSHPEYNCFAEINQIFSGKSPLQDKDMQCTIYSLLENEWSLLTSNSSYYSEISYMWRQPRRLWQRFPNVDVKQIYRSHMDMRRQICFDLNVKVLVDLSLDSYIKKEQNEAVKRKLVLEKKNILLGLIEAYLFEQNPKAEWLGEYTKKKRS